MAEIVRISLGFLGSDFVSKMWIFEERRPGTMRYRRSMCGCGAFGHRHELQAFLLRYLLEGLPEPDLTAFAHNTVVPNASLTSWRREEGLWVLEREFETDHLVERGVEPTESGDSATRTPEPSAR